MKKRLLITILAIALILGALGINALAESSESTPATPVVTVSYVETVPTLDGDATEQSWIKSGFIKGAVGAPDGRFGMLWKGEKLYLAVDTAGATAMSFTLNGKTATVDLTAATLAVQGMQDVKAAKKNNTVELEIPMKSFGFVLGNYGQTTDAEVKLTNASGTSAFTGMMKFTAQETLASQGAFSSTTITNAWDGIYGTYNPAAQTSGQVGITSTAQADGGYDYRLWNIYQSGKINYSVQGIYGYGATNIANALKNSGLLSVDFDMKIDDMPEYTDPTSGYNIFRQYAPAGVSFFISRGILGEDLRLSFTNLKDVGLVLYVGHGPLTNKYGSKTIQWNGPHKLNKELGEKFHVTTYYSETGEISMYIDGVEIFGPLDVGTNFTDGSSSTAALHMMLWSAYYNSDASKRPAGISDMLTTASAPKNSKANADVTVSNVKVGKVSGQDLLDSLTFDSIKGTNTDPQFITSDLVLPTNLTDGKLTANLQWTSSRPDVLDSDGVLGDPEEVTDVVLTATVSGTTITKTFNLKVVMPQMDAWKADSVTVDGNLSEYYDFARGYAFEAEAGKPSGKIAARFTKDTLYIGAEYANANMLAIQLGEKIVLADLANKTVDLDGAKIAVDNGKVELALPLDKLNLKVTKGLSKAMGVILANDTDTVGKNLLVGFYGVEEKAEVAYTGTGITVDGKLDEADWRLTNTAFGREGTPAGKMGQLWLDKDLYVAVDVADATSMKLVVAGNVIEIADLNNVPASAGVATQIAKSGTVVEMKIPFESFFNFYNYGQAMAMELELTNATGVSGIYGNFVFSSWKLLHKTGQINTEITNSNDNYYGAFNSNARLTGQTGITQTPENGGYTYHLWNIYQEGKENYAVQGIYANPTAATANALKNSGTLSVRFDLQIDDMPEYTDPTSGHNVWRRNPPAGMSFLLGRGIFGEDIRLSFTNVKGQGLSLYVGHGPLISASPYGGGGTMDVPQWDGPYKLNKELGEKFSVDVLYMEDGKIAVTVDGEVIFALKDMGASFSHNTTTTNAHFQMVLWSPYYNSNDSKRPAGIDEILNPDSSIKNADANSDVYISNLVIGSITSDDILDNLTFDTIKGVNGSENTVVRDLNLPATVTDGRLVSNLTWKSSNENVVETNGKVNTQDTNTRVTLTAELTGSNPVEGKKFNLMVNTPVMDTWYGSESHFDRGYTFAAAAGKPAGSIASRWDDKNLYFTAETVDATKFVVTLGGKTYSANVSGNKASVTVPLSNLGKIEKDFSLPASLSLTGNGGSVSKTVALSFFGVPTLRNASWHNGTITIDGIAQEGDWKFYSKLTGRPGAAEGELATAWNGTDLYLAVKTGDATKLNLKLNGKSATIDLATLTVSGMQNVTVAKDEGAVELKIPFASFGFSLQNYTQTMAFTVELENAAGVSGYEGPLGFSSLEHKVNGGVSSQEITNIVPNMYGGITEAQMKQEVAAARNSGQAGFATTDDGYGNKTVHLWNIYQEGKKNYAVQGIYHRAGTGTTLSSINNVIVAEFDLKIDDMPVYNQPQRGDQVWRTLEPAGLGITLYRGILGEDLKLGISNTAEGIVVYVGYSTNRDYGSGSIVWDGPYKLGIEMGEEAHIALHHTIDGELTIYVNEQVVYEKKDVGYNFGNGTKPVGAGLNFTLWTPYYRAELNADILNPDSSPKNSGANTDLYISNVKVGEITAYDLMDSLTFDTIRGQNGSADSIMRDLSLPTVLSDGNKLSTNLTWKSSNTSLIANNGKVTTGTEDTAVKVTATLAGTSISKSFDVIVVLPAVDAWRADSVKLDGVLSEYYNFTHGYTFLPEAGKPSGSFGIRWDLNTLYIGAEFNNADKLTVTVGGKTVVADLAAKKISGVKGAVIAVGNGAVELGIPMSNLNFGTITEGTNKPITVAFSKGNAKVEKSVGMHFFGVQTTQNVQWNDGTIAIDGVLEGDWLMYADFNGRKGSPVGGVAKMWNGSDLLLAVDAGDADKLFVTVCGKSTMIDLTADPLTDSAGLAQAIAKQGSIVEMKISFKGLFTLRNYGQTIPVAVEVENKVASSGAHMNLAFSSQEYAESANSVWSQQTTTIVPNMYGNISNELSAEQVKQAIKNGQVGEKTIVDANGNATYHMWNIFQEGKENYAVQGVYTYLNNEAINTALAAIKGIMTVDFDLKIDDMPEYIEPWRGDQIWRTLEPAGLGITLARGIVGENIKLGISNVKGEGLVLYVGHGPVTNEYGTGTVQWDGPYKLGVEMGEKFHASIHYTEEGEIAFYVNDKVVYEFKDVGCDFSGKGTAGTTLGFTLWTPYYNEELNAHILNPDSTPKSAACNTDLYVSNVKLGNITAYDLMDSLTFDTIRGKNGSADSVMRDLSLPTVLSDGNKLSANLTWKSSNTSLIANNGKVTTGTKNTPVTVTATLAGTSISKSFDVIVVLPAVDTWRADTVELDGVLSEYYNFTRGYTFAPQAGKPSGSFGIRWDKNTLYIGAEFNNADKLTVTVGGKTVVADLAAKKISGVKGAVIAVGNGAVELGIPMSSLSLGTITEGTNKPITVAFSKGNAKVEKSVGMHFFGVQTTQNVQWNDGTIAIDGVLEGDWLMYADFNGRKGSPVGGFAKMWNGSDLLLAVDAGDADKLFVTVCGKSTMIDLTADTLTDTAGMVQKIAKQGSIVEMKISFKGLFTLRNYGQTIPVAVEVENKVASSGAHMNLAFSSQEYEASANSVWSQTTTTVVPNMYGNISDELNAERIKQAIKNGQAGEQTIVDANGNATYHMWNIFQEGKENYAVQGVYTYLNSEEINEKLTSIEGIMSVDFDLKIDDMPEYIEPWRGDQIWRTYEPAGLGITISRGIVGENIRLGISNTKAEGLVLYVGYGPTTRDYGSGTIQWDGPHKLGTKMGEKFHVSVHYTEKGEVAVFVNDKVIYEFKEVGCDFSGTGVSSPTLGFTLWTPYYNEELNAHILNPDSTPKNADFSTDLYVSNVKLGNITAYDLMDSLTFDTIRGKNGSADSVMRDLSLPTVLSDGNKLSANLTWKSSNTSLIANNGKVTTGTKNTPVTVTATLAGTSISKSFDVIVVLPAVDAWRANSVNVNGTLTEAEYYGFTRGYTFAPQAGKPDGSVGIRWNLNTLYIGAKFNNADKLTIAIGGKTIVADLAANKVSGVTGANMVMGKGTVELGIPMSNFNFGKITEGMNKTIAVTLSKGSTKVQKSLGLHFFGVQTTQNIQWNDGTIAIDGVQEGDWMMYADFNGRVGSPVGGVAKMWNGSDLFLAVDVGDADKLFVSVCGRNTVIDLTADTLTDTAGLAQAIAKQGNIVEMKISFKKFFTLSNYGQTIPVTVEVENEVASSGIHMNLAFSSQEYEESANSVWSQTTTTVVPNVYGGISDELNAERIKQAIKNGQAGEQTTVDEHGNATYHMWNIFQEGKDNYAVQGVYTYLNNEAVNEALTSIEGTMSVDFDLKIDDMPEYIEPWRGDQIWRTYEPAGLGITISRGIVGENIRLGISNTKAEGLVLYVGYGPTTRDYGTGTIQWDGPHKLGTKMGEKFHVSVHYTEKGEVAVFVNDKVIYEFKEVGCDFSGKGVSSPTLGFTLWTPYYNEELNAHILNPDSTPKNADFSTDLYVSNVKLGNVTAYDILDNLTFDDIRGTNGSEHTLISKLTLPGVISDGKITANLKWTSSNTLALSNTGYVTAQDERTPVVLTATLAGTNISKKFNLTVTLPYVDAWQANFVKLDGEVNEYFGLDRGYTFAKASGKPSGTLAALWNQEKDRLYVAIKHTNTTKIKMTLGSKIVEIDIAAGTISGSNGAKNLQMKTGKDVLEFSMPLSLLRLEDVKVGETVDIRIEMINDKTSVYKNLQLCFYGTPGYTQAAWNKGDVVIDGQLTEPDWQTYTQITGRSGTPEGTFGDLWNGKTLYLAVNTDGAKSMSLMLNGKTATIDLTKATPTVTGMKNVKIAKSGDTVELKIPFSSIDLELLNYTQTIEMRLELTNSVGTSGFVGSMYFSSREYDSNVVGQPTQSAHNNVEAFYGTKDNVTNAKDSGQIGFTYETDANGFNTYHIWNKYVEGEKNYPVQFISTGLTEMAREALESIENNITLDFDLLIEDMPAYKEPTNGKNIWRMYGGAGLAATIGRGINNEEIMVTFSNIKEGLCLYVGFGPFTNTYGSNTIQWDGPYLLNKELGQKFHVSMHYMEDGQLAIYIDDLLIYAFRDVGENFGQDTTLGFTTYYPYYALDLSDDILDETSAPKNSDANSDVYISNVQLGTAACYDLMDLLEFESFRGTNGSQKTIISDLKLPTKLNDGKLSTSLVWESDKEKFVSNTGKVTTNYREEFVKLTAAVKGAEAAMKKEFDLTVTLPYLDAWYGSNVTIDGKATEYHDFERGYAFIKESGKPTGNVAARWDEENLYLAVKYQNADKLTFEVGKKTLTVDLVNGTADMKDVKVALGKGIVELLIPKKSMKLEELGNLEYEDVLVSLSKGEVTTEKWLRMTLYGSYGTGYITWAGENISIDGNVIEHEWQMYGRTSGREGSPAGLIGKMWSDDALYLAVVTGNADTMILTVNGKETTINLSTLRDSAGLTSNLARGVYNYEVAYQDPSDETLEPEKEMIKSPVYELKIPFDKVGFNLFNYGQTIDVKVELISDVGASCYGAILEVNNTEYKNALSKLSEENKMNSQMENYTEALNSGFTTGQLGIQQLEQTNGKYSHRLWNRYIGKGQIACPNLWTRQMSSAGNPYPDMYHPEGTFQFDCDIRIDNLGVYGNLPHYIASYGVDGLTINLTRGVEGQSLQMGIGNVRRDPETGHIGFMLGIYHKKDAEWKLAPLYIEKCETFHMTVQITQEGDTTVYINDQFLITVEGAAGAYDPDPDKAVFDSYFCLWVNEDQSYATRGSSEFNLDITVTNVTVGTSLDESLLDYLTFDDIKDPNRRENTVWQSFNLPATVTDGQMVSELVWTSSNAAIKIENGKAIVTPQDKDTEVILTAALAGDPSVKKEFKLTVTPQVVDADINKYANAGTMNGGSVQAKWNKENITFAITHNGADTINLTVGEKKAQVVLATAAVTGIEGGKATVKGNTVEVTLPRSALGLEIKEYHQTNDFTVETVKSGKTLATKNFKIEFVGFESIVEEYQKSKALADFAASIKTVSDNVAIPTTFQSAYLDVAATLRWESDTPKILSNEGKLDAPAKVGLNVRLKVFVNEVEAGTVTAYVKAKGQPDLQAGTNVRAAFGRNIKVDGAITEQWSLNNNIVSATKVIGKMGAMWDAEYLYLAFETGSEKAMTLTVEGKTAQITLSGSKPAVSGDLKIASIARSGKYTEVKIAMQDVGLAKVEDYGDELAISIMLGDGKFDGKLILTSIEYFTTDNPENRFVMSSNDALEEDKDIRGWSDTGNGYYLYANYDPEGENSGAQTIGVGFNKANIAGAERYTQFTQSGQTGLYVEFDMQVLSMPVYTGEEDISGSHLSLATNGLNINIVGNNENAQKKVEWLQLGLFNNGSRLVFVHRLARYDFQKVPLDKSLGDKFRMGIVWNADDSFDLFIDDELVYSYDGVCHYEGTSTAKPGVSFRLTRSADEATRDYDNMQVKVENLAAASYYGECLLENLDFPGVRGNNINKYAVIEDMDLVSKFVGEQITSGKLTWESSDESVIATDGTVTRPELGYEAVELKVTNDLGHSQDMTVVVKGKQMVDDVLTIQRDYNPAATGGTVYDQGTFMLDYDSSSLIKDQKEVKKVNVVTLTELDNYGRLYEDFLTLWVSDDNETYTEVENFKLLHKDNKWYIYDFEAECRYVKVHCTHHDVMEGDVIGVSSDMIDVSYDEIFGDGGESFGTKKTVTVKNTSKNDRIDWTWSFTPQELGVVSLAENMADIRVMQGDDYLYHYVEDGMVYVRIPEVKSGGKAKITVLSGNQKALDISNKDCVYEILYGTTELLRDPHGYNWQGGEYLPVRTMVRLNDGTIIADSISRSSEGYTREQVYSTDGGRSWQGLQTIAEFDPIAHPGGFVYDSHANIVYAWGYKSVTTAQGPSSMIMHILKLDMNGVTVDEAKWEYVCEFAPSLAEKVPYGIMSYQNYNNGILMSSYDGDGPNVDMLIPFHSGEGDDWAICGARTLYTVDAGKTWIVSESFTSYASSLEEVELGFEYGISESTLLELENGTVIKLSRNQGGEEMVSFCYSYSTDYGKTWTEEPIQSMVWSPNTQPMINESYDDQVDVLMWAGNNLHGGDSYARRPVVLALPEASPENCTLTGIQYPYNRGYMQALDSKTRSTNIYDVRTADGDLLMYLGEGGSQPDNGGMLRIDDVHDFMTKTKGTYDSFENDSIKYEGWTVVKGGSYIDYTKATNGEASMKTYGMVVRAVTSFRYGSVGADLYWNEGKRVQFELASAFIDEEDRAATVKFTINHDGSVSVDGVDTGLKFVDGWNSFVIDTDIPNGVANLTINGGEPAPLGVNTEYGDYATYIRIHSDAYVWVDNLVQIGEEDMFHQNKAGFLPTDSDSGSALVIALAIGIPALIVVAVAAAVVFKKKAAKKSK